ncbi:MAG: cell surface protein SprA [Candidatus Eisenbacteria bacterium]|nr:cell surface protein SprA [Candidatus Eisenbacteria bacterium]
MRLSPNRLKRAIGALLLFLAVAAQGAGLPADVERSGSLSLIRNPALRNLPDHLYHRARAPYRSPFVPRLDGYPTPPAPRLRADLERGRLVVTQEREGTSLVHPWVTPLPEYLADARLAEIRRALLENNRQLKGRSGGAKGSGLFNIDIPVRFPKTLGRILGQGANIQVSGSESITFSGETQYYIKSRDNESGGQKKFPELDMRQQLQIQMTGTIGEKVKVEVQHNSESQVPLENRIKLRYEGFEDEVIQRIEVGNTDLALPGNQFVSFSARQQGLFGVKMIGKAGKLDFTAVMSQQQGKTDNASFTGRSKEETRLIDGMDYVKGRFFVLNDYRPIEDLRVFTDDDDASNNTSAQLKGYARHYRNGAPVDSLDGYFDELEEGTDYLINREVGILTMRRSLGENYTLAVYFTTTAGDTVGNIPPEATTDSTASIEVKLIRPPSLFYRPTDERFGETWYYQIRNLYDLGASNIQGDVKIRIVQRAAGAEESYDQQNGIPFAQILGLDLVNNTDQTLGPDDYIDAAYYGKGTRLLDGQGQPEERPGIPTGDLPFIPTILIDKENGLLVFPDLRPFDPVYNHQHANANTSYRLEEPNDVIYDNHDPQPTDSKYQIEVSFRTSQTSFSLNRSNIIEGSEVVKLNGRTLTRGVDYRIIYEIGQIEFLAEEASDPDADIQIDFEYAPFLSQAQKSLAGFAGTYNYSESTKLSTIWLYKGNKTPYRRPRLGQESSRIVVGGLSVSTEHRPEFLTRLTDKIPGVRAREESHFRLDLESAATFPNPNVKNAIYLDDMEGTEESSSFGLTRRQWDPTSIPKIGTSQEDYEREAEKRFRDVWWYNPKNAVSRGDINPDLTDEERRKFVPVLEVALRNGTIADGGEDAWGGVMRLVSKTGLDMKERKFFEIWVNDQNRRKGKMHIDMGLLGEDAMWSTDPPNNSLDSEDRVPRDGVLDDTGNKGENDEDTGLDGLFNSQESGSGGDPAGDDWAYEESDPDNYSRINGTEDNGFLDTEDLNGNGKVDEESGYFRFTIDFTDEEYLAAVGKQEARTSWRLYRVPLAKSEAREIYTQPTFDQGVKYVRIWFEDLDTTDAVFQIYSMDVTGNRWLEAGIQEENGDLIPIAEVDPLEIFAAGVINNKEGEDYDPPPVEIRVERQVPEKEQSLVLNYENLKPGHTGSVFRALFDDENYTRYENMEFWVKRAEPDVEPELYPDPVFFFRFGGDSLNFYEVERTLDYEGWEQVELDLVEMTRLKLQEEPRLDSLYGREVEVREATSGPYTYRAVGIPSMTKVRRLTFGISNRDHREMTGVVWVDDLRLTNVKGDAGYAARLGVDLALSDLLDLSVDYRKVGKDFRRLSGGGGGQLQEENPRNGSDETDLSVSGSVRLGKFLEGVGVAAPLTVGWNRNETLPELQNASDVVLVDPSTERTEKKSENAAISFQRTRKAESPWLYYTFDAMRLRLNGRRGTNFTPTKVDTSSSWGVDWSWSYQPRFQTDLQVFRSWKVNPLPTSVNLSARRERTETRSLDIRSETYRKVTGRTSSSSYSFVLQPLKSETFSSDFNFASNRDHLYGKALSFLPSVNRGLETSRNHQTKLSYSPRFSSLLDWFKPRFSYTSKYTEDIPIGQRQITVDETTGDTLSVVTLHNVQNTNTSTVDFGIGVARLFDLIPDGSGKEDGGDGGRSPAPADSGAAEGGGDPRFGPGHVLRGIKNAGSRIGDVTATVTLGRDSRYDRLTGRPDLKYQFGFTDEVDTLLQYRQQGQSVNASRSRDVGMRASSSIRLVPSMSLRLSFNQNERKGYDSRNQTASKSRTWPDLSYNWDGLEEFWKLSRYLKSASLDVGYNRKRDLSGKTLVAIDKETISKNWNPLFQIDVELQNGLRGSISADRTERVSLSYLGGGSESVSQSRGYSASLNYRMSSRKRINIPILGKGTKGSSFTATTTFALDFNYSTDKEEEKKPYLLSAHTRDISIRPRITWTWLQNLSGSLELRFGERRNLKNENRSTRTIGASISALFKF